MPVIIAPYKARTQSIMMRQQTADRFPQRDSIERRLELEQHRLIVVIRQDGMLSEESFLNGSHRDLPRNFRLILQAHSQRFDMRR
jgi:hypothetical protein